MALPISGSIVQYINGGQNPNRLRAVAVQDV